ncbi:ligand-gated ion channel [Chlorella sorokiniana]|uniref:Ligand-gated ion channel n=1 Tax=Chlorella sorokiniana TaxID=3076 RepID=A0A2P6TEY6_CHLSO|nr:ligand-gated ion channel [Chlorella sorokiniana]|eukprot:PRW32538.1 ligand-gated ion channel [Chlorella sorokiniana]
MGGCDRWHRLGSRALPLSLALAVLLLAAAPPPAAAQMISPLAGQNSPGLNTTEVFMSVYLDRLLEVDEKNYRHSEILYFLLTWNDPEAAPTIAANTERWKAGQAGCDRQCSDFAGNVSCCDGIFLPSLTFKNAYALPQDRPSQDRILAVAAPNNSVAWMVYVQVSCYQPLKLQHFPFDSFDLVTELTLQNSWGPNHPGLKLVPSAAGTTLTASGSGDAVSQWSIDYITLQATSTPAPGPMFFATASEQQSNPADPLGLTTTDAPFLRALMPGVVQPPLQQEDMWQMTIKIRITRFYGYHLLNTVLPVVILGLLCFIVFSLERRDLSDRLGIVVTLFLSMAAVQFVIQEGQPASSYILPTQQAALATYLLLGLIAAESIVVYNIDQWPEMQHKRTLRENARRQYHKERAAAKAQRAERRGGGKGCWGCFGGGGSSGGLGLPVRRPAGAGEEGAEAGGADAALPGEGSSKAALAAASNGQPAAASAAGAARRRHPWGVAGLGCCGGPHAPADACASSGEEEEAAGEGTLSQRRLQRQSSVRFSAAYYSYLAWKVDRIAFVLLLLAYCLAIILIFVLQHGPVQLEGY